MSASSHTPNIVTDVPRLPLRAPQTHKGQVGRVAIFAGSRGMSGAACLAGLGALRGGAGLVRVYTPASCQPIVAASEPCLMTVPLAEKRDGELDVRCCIKPIDEEWPTALALGPGLGQSDGARLLVFWFFTRRPPFKRPIVVDADGLNALAGLDETRRSEKEGADAPPPWWQYGLSSESGKPGIRVLTPHPGEMSRLRKGAGLPELSGDSDETRVRMAHEYASLTGAVVVLKGHRTVVCTQDRVYVNTTGNPGMATGGMGDVLTGLIAALIGQGLSAFDAACLGVYVHGTAADLLAKRIGPIGYLAREVADALPTALAKACRTPMGFK